MGLGWSDQVRSWNGAGRRITRVQQQGIIEALRCQAFGTFFRCWSGSARVGVRGVPDAVGLGRGCAATVISGDVAEPVRARSPNHHGEGPYRPLHPQPCRSFTKGPPGGLTCGKVWYDGRRKRRLAGRLFRSLQRAAGAESPGGSGRGRCVRRLARAMRAETGSRRAGRPGGGGTNGPGRNEAQGRNDMQDRDGEAAAMAWRS